LNFVSKHPAETALAETLAGINQPAWIVDVRRGAILGSNGRVTTVWGVPLMTPAMGGSLLSLHARLVARPRSSTIDSVLHGAPSEHLKFSTGAGARIVSCKVHLLDDSVGPDLLLIVAQSGPEPMPKPPRANRRVVRIEDELPRPVAADLFADTPPSAREPAIPRRAPAPPAVPAPAPAPLSDAETMQEIARRIRQGAAKLSNGGHLPEIAETPDNEPPLPVRQDVEPIGGSGTEPVDLPAQLAHEIRTPLAAIISLAEVITEERLGPWPNERYRGYVRDILDSARHGLDVVDAILRDAGNQPGASPVFAKVDLNAEVEAICTSLQPLAEKSKARLGAALISGLPAVVADRRNVRQMLLNLITNSIKHGGTDVRIKVTTGYELGGDVWVEVEDNGPGMAATAASERTAVGDRRRNAGLGLPLTRALATANGAKLDISNRQGGGVRARIIFGPERAASVRN
jgi:signal transduction histidine kinase